MRKPLHLANLIINIIKELQYNIRAHNKCNLNCETKTLNRYFTKRNIQDEKMYTLKDAQPITMQIRRPLQMFLRRR